MMPTREQELAVLRSVIYASLFDYPITLAQLQASLIGVRATEAAILTWWRSSDLLQSTIEFRHGLFFPAARRDLIDTRRRRESISTALLDRDRHIINLIGRMPFVRMVALSGSLAHLNAEDGADLDLFVITAPNRVWSVTFAVLLISRLLGWRKHMCLNYVVSEHAMPVEPQDLFSANQIIHLKPLMGHDVFARFLDANPFVREIYPNFHVARPIALRALHEPVPPKPGRRRNSILERLSHLIYSWHLRRKAATWQSRDQVRLEEECLKLHTSSHRASTMEKFECAMAAALEREPAYAASPLRRRKPVTAAVR